MPISQGRVTLLSEGWTTKMSHYTEGTISGFSHIHMPIPDCCPVSTDLRPSYSYEPFKRQTNPSSIAQAVCSFQHLENQADCTGEALSFNLPNSLPKAEIRCNICTQRKSTQRNSLSKSDRIEKKLEIITADIIGPFEVDTFNKGSFLLTISHQSHHMKLSEGKNPRLTTRSFLNGIGGLL
ncbi:uncharacterized protein VP01_4323g1 [Puccinia sorghi]|uniref:Uncharacterized protein n=1 Tax=Puccinia sorghi TaxID=27349 RepID=A0A0L6US08_9BASI|nr:uncharacterized protein VP01_4323g1 [Puccinia sorghi]